jgi:tetratricopeptide (TPR) repeat protein
MIFKILLFSFLSLQVMGMDIDVSTLQEIISNDSKAYKERLILAKYYEKQGNNLKAELLAKEVLKIKPKDKEAKKLLYKIKRKKEIDRVFRDASLSKPIDSLEAQKRLQSYYDESNYQFYSNLYQALVESNVALSDPYHIKAAYIYLWDAQYKEANKALRRLKEKNSLDAAKIKSDICYYEGKYSCAAQLYEKLYNASYELDYAIKLLNSYIYLGETQKAQRFYNFLIRKYPSSKKLNDIGKKLDSIRDKYLLDRKKAYEEDPNDITLENYAAALNALGKVDENLALLKAHNEKMATPKSLLLEAKYLTWADHSNEALNVLKSRALKSDLDAKLLLGKIYAWEQQFDEAKKYLDEVIAKTKNKTTLYEAKKMHAYVDMWEKKRDLAKKNFEALLKENPQDNEIKEALMELNNDYAGLIKIYKKRLAKSGSLADEKRLADLYIGNKEPKKAIEYLKKYVQSNPDDLEAMKSLALLLIDNKEYYEGFGYLEYYAAQKHDSKSEILLAKYYYWNGFSKEAIDVLNRLLEKDYQNKEALELKAKILKIAPRFTTSNSGATIGMYYDELGKKDLEIADALYFNSHYEAALMYYENYLKNHPDDHKVRMRYAFALENARWYGKAEGEFSLLRWSNDSNEIRYHYAYNLMKNGKYKKARKELLELKKSVYKKITPQLDAFLKKWEKDWESQNYERYAQNYDSSFRNNELWAFRKQQLFSQLKYIAVSIYDPIYRELKNGHYQIRFFQDYATDKRSDKGYKTLEISCDNNVTQCVITHEEWQAGKYKKENSFSPYIDNALKELDRLEKSPKPLTNRRSYKVPWMSSKKKTLLLSSKRNDIMIYI